jgi:serine/threonine protein kinase
MTEDSAFFDLRDDSRVSFGRPECIHRSEKGWTELYRVERDGRFRVLKAIQADKRGQQRYEALLRKEYEIGYSLDHPAIRSVYSFGHSEAFGHYIEMEWVDGCSLSDYLASCRPDTATSRKLLLQLCEALSYLHARQIIHRDLKPSNIMVTHNGLNVKLIDFGLSDADSYAVLKAAAGTASYAAPELLRGEPVDSRADIWSLGMIIALLLPSRRGIIRRCTLEDRNRRYPDAASVALALKKRPVGWIVAAAVIVVAVCLLYILLVRPLPQESVPQVETEQVESAISDPAAIDELFRQATEMILSEDNQ